MDTRTLVKNIINSYDPDLDTADGTGITDVLINPLANVLDYVFRDLKTVQNNLSLSDYEEIDEEVMDAIAANFLMERQSGTKATGNAQITFDEPVNLSLPAETIFKTEDGVEFKNPKEFQITTSQMRLNNDNAPLYDTGNIPIEAIDDGEVGQVDPGTITQIEDALFDFVGVSNPVATTGGVEPETNTEFYERLLESVTSDTATSARSLKKILSNTLTVKRVDVVGFGDAEMVRDLSYDRMTMTQYVREDFFGKQSTVIVAPHNHNIAGVFIASGIQPPLITLVSINEFSDDDYLGLYRKGDALYTEGNSYKLFEDNFSEATLQASWIQSDAQLGMGVLKYENEITISGGNLKMGISPASDGTVPVVIAQQAYATFKQQINSLMTSFSQT
ncbi:MAG: baseplate J/gp47 family protein [Candidatus Hodarchaeales archaeon]|jgi:hypothetical protein